MVSVTTRGEYREYFEESLQEQTDEVKDVSPDLKRIEELDERVCSEMEQLMKFYAESTPMIILAVVGVSDFHDEIIMIQRALKANDIYLEDPNVRRFVIPLLESKVSGLLRDGWERFVTKAAETHNSMKSDGTWQIMKRVVNKKNGAGLVPLSSRSNVGHISTIKSTLLMTARIHIAGNDRSEEVHVLFDPGSQISLVTSRLVKYHKLRGIPGEMSINGAADMECPIKNYSRHVIRL
ncbi:unnamed protein product [Lepeophtheirus salmonis]|uniref:(salmon louse) hypothetical protein n=1 Tax=Lepeophtheirus salmonis TaxID=72036 RepID=A0A7R8HD09_LEPSM|nr:unnamed protein product [Lepeophtheirus salmonis]CAF3025169.1 unnamed protein product [Lepeophtheirus salmonis]